MRLARNWIGSVVVAVIVLMAAGSAQAGPRYEDCSKGKKLALMVESVATSVAYTPSKVALAFGSAVTSGLVMAFSVGSSHETAGEIIRTGFRGDWWVHPDVITGHRSLRMVGGLD